MKITGTGGFVKMKITGTAGFVKMKIIGTAGFVKMKSFGQTNDCKALEAMVTLSVTLSSTTAVDMTLPSCASLACGMCRTASKA